MYHKAFIFSPSKICIIISILHGITTVAQQDNNNKVSSNKNMYPVSMAEKKEILEWSMPTAAEPLVIHVPAEATFKEFVLAIDGEEPTGFCIDVFKYAVGRLDYDLHYKFQHFHGLYNEMLDQVQQNFSAAVGDITILADREKAVEFTQPYMELRLTMVVPEKSGSKGWLIVKPFTPRLWIALSIACLFTMAAVWFLEHESNEDFRGPWRTQLSTTVWFTCSTLFFVQSDRLRNDFTRVVMFVWFFTVFVVTSSYVASLTSMLTVERLDPIVTSIDSLRSDNAPVGYSSNSFIRKYLQNVLHFHPNNTIGIPNEDDYEKAFKNGTIKAAFIGSPYERVFLSKHPTGFMDVEISHRFGGFGFAFPKGTPFARDFSVAFLQLSEDGTLEALDQKWFKPFSHCPDPDVKTTLDLDSFLVLLIATSITTTIVLVVYLFKRTRPNEESHTTDTEMVYRGTL